MDALIAALTGWQLVAEDGILAFLFICLACLVYNYLLWRNKWRKK